MTRLGSRASRVSRVTLVVALASLTACSSILGLNDLQLDPQQGDGSAGDDGATEANGGEGGGGPDGPLADGPHVDGMTQDAGDGTVPDGPTSDGPASDGPPSDSTSDTNMADTTPSDSGGCTLPQIMCNTICVNPTNDSLNCGSCGHDCQTGMCTARACQPVRLAFNQSSPMDLVVDGTSLYFTNNGNGTVMKCPTSGCGGAPTMLASGQIAPERITFDGTYVYWTDYGDGNPNGAIRRVVKANGTGLMSLVTGRTFPEGVAVDGTYVYWAERVTTTGIMHAPLGGGAAVTTRTANTPTSLVFDGTSLFWATEGGAVARCVPSGGACAATIPLFNGTDFTIGIGVDGSKIYWATLLASGSVYSASKTDGTGMQLLASSQPFPLRMTTDGSEVFWTNRGPSQGVSADGSIMQCAVGGCAGIPATVAMGQADPHGVAVDNKTIYWANAGTGGSNGEIWKVAR